MAKKRKLMTEEERAEAARLWWSENGKYVVIGAVLGIGSVLGWRGWEEYQTRHARAAASLYYQMYDDLAGQFNQQTDSLLEDDLPATSTPTDVAASSTPTGATGAMGAMASTEMMFTEASTDTEMFADAETPETEADRLAALADERIAREMEAVKRLQERLKLTYKPELFETLREKYADTVYPAMAYMEVARVDVENRDLEKAVDKLNWVARTTTHVVLKHIADIRRARVLTALERYDEALQVLRENEFPEEMQYLVEEARGDAWAGKGDKDKAAQAYEAAVEKSARTADFLRMKLDNLGHEDAMSEMMNEESETMSEPASTGEESEAMSEPASMDEESEAMSEPASMGEESEAMSEPASMGEESEAMSEPASMGEESEAMSEPASMGEESEAMSEPASMGEESEAMSEPAPPTP